MHPTPRYFLWLLLLVVALVFIAGLALLLPKSPSLESPRTPPPAVTKPGTTFKDLENKKLFSLLFAFYPTGFEPAEGTVKKGDVVRFINNSSNPMHISAGTPAYPGTNSSCAGSPLDSCTDISPGDYWEFELDTPGTWQFSDQHSGMTGIIHVTQ